MDNSITSETENLDFSDNNLRIFLGDGNTTIDEDGLVWKDILREGEWAYRPVNNKAVPIPLKVTSGKATEEGQIGMADLVEAFENNAKQHVTIPTTHNDKPDENTGYVRKLKIEERGGKKFLSAGLEFTEPDILGKVKRKSIANTSAGIMFNYLNKETGEKYSQVLGHVALTNNPWLTGMETFSEDEGEHDIIDVMLNTNIDFSNSYNSLSRQIREKLSDENKSYYVLDVTDNAALVEDPGGKTWMIPFSVTDEELEISGQDEWLEAEQKWVQASEDFIKFSKESTQVANFADRANRGAESDNGGNLMDSNNKDESTLDPGATSTNDPAQDSLLSDDVVSKEDLEAQTGLITDLSEKNEKLQRKVHEMTVNEKIVELRDDLGLSEYPGFLTVVKDIMLADDGSTVLSLSEESGDSVNLSITDAVDRIINALPKDEKTGKVELSASILSTDDKNRPDVEPSDDTNLSEEEKVAEAAEFLGIDFPSKDGE